jgi:ComF family protein
MLVRACNAAIRVLLAPSCAACRRPLDRPLENPVCGACWRLVERTAPPWCARCGDELHMAMQLQSGLCTRCRVQPRRFAAARSAGRYEGVLRDLVHALKYQRRRALAPPLAALIAQAAGDLLRGADATVPVPLHPLRAMQRGFNQADDLARALGLPVWRVLRRRRHGRPQASLPADRRRDNVRDAFALARLGGGLAFVRRPWCSLDGRVVVLVDDVMTTGETADACSEVLLAAGVSDVRVVTAARAVAIPPPARLQPPLPSSAPRR